MCAVRVFRERWEDRVIVTFAKGFPEEVRCEIHEAQNGYGKLSLDKIDDFHHRLPNSKENRKKFPLFLNSVFNCFGLSRKVHDSGAIHQDVVKVTEKEAMLYETWLALFAIMWYNLGKHEETRDGSYRDLSMQELREREDLSQIAAEVLSQPR